MAPSAKASNGSGRFVFWVAIVGGFLLGSSSRKGILDIGGSMAMKQTNSYFQSSAMGKEEAEAEESNNPIDTTLIIITSLIPTHPSLRIINQTIDSLRFLQGLPSNSPLFISIDKPAQEKQPGDFDRLRQYIDNLNQTYGVLDHVTLIEAPGHVGISGNIKQAVDRVQTKYLYMIQHDFAFARTINHTETIQVMEQYPKDMRIVRFNKRSNFAAGVDKGDCFGMETPVDNVNGLHFTKTKGWSDNNHLATKEYYDEVLGLFHEFFKVRARPVRYNMPLEWVMMNHAGSNCTWWGPHLYGARGEPPTLRHLDGRNTQQ
uniref:Uncharacterized protein n=1 Tax=Craspedostauros australis TaxID=1486917 RepID=A0A7R9WX55_9STRA|mmetsp:Transcript_22948/g.63933  ORF Transcript_22948/g.63933 Transcript_22948/m.63933 type:complete len:317 (+) Transcript_22948:212-1162(+)